MKNYIKKFNLSKNNFDKIKIRELKNKFLKLKNLTFSYEKKFIEKDFNNAVNAKIILLSCNKEKFKFCDEAYEIVNKNLRKIISQ